MEQPSLVYVGKIVEVLPIPEADFIVSATVVCGNAGRWRGVVRKNELHLGMKCIVYLPDSVIPECDQMRFMESRGWRVKMCRFRGAPSEVLIMPMPLSDNPAWSLEVGTDVTAIFGVTKYFKPIPANLQGLAKGDFPSFIPKTDELNYQRYPDLVEQLHGKPYFITEKADGSSTTAYRYRGQFGVCSRNLELVEDDDNGYWKLAKKYELESKLPEGYAIQWETCGPKIQSNPMGLSDLAGYAFNVYNIPERRHLEYMEFNKFCYELRFPMVRLVSYNDSFDKDVVHNLGEGTYENGKQREGVVVRSQTNIGHAPISFKVINLNYEK